MKIHPFPAYNRREAPGVKQMSDVPFIPTELHTTEAAESRKKVQQELAQPDKTKQELEALLAKEGDARETTK